MTSAEMKPDSMGRLGHMKQFSPDRTEALPMYYLERLEFYFAANGVVQERKHAALCSCGRPLVHYTGR